MMKRVFIMFLVLLGTIASAWAHDRGGRVRMGVYIGVPLGHPWYDPYPYPYPYYYPPTVIVREPQVYIERGVPQPSPQSEVYWYYCNSSRTYYPYVKECPEGWQRVVPTPPPPK